MSQIKVEYLDHMGSDLTVARSARVSFDKETDWEIPQIYDDEGQGYIDGPKQLSKRDQKLIKYLARENHFSPFTHAIIQVRETVPIFVSAQRFKHVVGFTYNSVSRRYVDDEPEFYVPDAWRKRAEDKKQGSSDEVVEKLYHKDVYWGKTSDEYQDHIDRSQELYRFMIENGVAPEQARMILPQSMMTSYYCTGSLAAFARAYKLRSYPDAQKEIRDLAQQWDEIIRPLFPHSWAALVD